MKRVLEVVAPRGRVAEPFGRSSSLFARFTAEDPAAHRSPSVRSLHEAKLTAQRTDRSCVVPRAPVLDP